MQLADNQEYWLLTTLFNIAEKLNVDHEKLLLKIILVFTLRLNNPPNHNSHPVLQTLS